MAIEFTPNFFTASYTAAIVAIILRDIDKEKYPRLNWFHNINGRDQAFKMAIKYGLELSKGDLESAEAMAKIIYEDHHTGYHDSFVRELEYHLYHWADRTLLVCNTVNRYIRRLRNYTQFYDGVDFTVPTRCPVVDFTKGELYLHEQIYFGPNPYTRTQGWFLNPDHFPHEVLLNAEYHSKHYDPLPWNAAMKGVDGHYAKMSLKFPGQVSFYENDQRRLIGRRLCMKPGRYLTRFYPEMDLQTVRDWAAKADNQARLQFAATPEEIEAVYLNGPSSCMAHDTDEYNGHIHPTAPYGNSDIQLAYIGDVEKKVTARAVVWPEKKLVGRIYGDWHRMVPLLKADGWDVKNADDPSSYYHRFEGARIRAIKDENNEGRLICPYIDGMGQGHLRDGWLVLGAYKYTPGTKEPYYPHYEVQTDSGSCWLLDTHYIADLDEERTQAWVGSNCGWDAYHDEWVYSRVMVITQCDRHGNAVRHHPMGPHRAHQYYHCAWRDLYYYTEEIPFVEIDGDKIPAILASVYRREKGIVPEVEEIQEEFSYEKTVGTTLDKLMANSRYGNQYLNLNSTDWLLSPTIRFTRLPGDNN